jgi:hypothetical protein
MNHAPPNTRRVFLTRAAALGIASAGAGLLWSKRHPGVPADLAAVPSAPAHGLEQFVPLVGTVFTAPDLALTLSQAEALPHHQPRTAEQFSLIFTTPDAQPIESRIYAVQHPELGSLELFVSPIGAKPGIGQAIFNLSRQTA